MYIRTKVLLVVGILVLLITTSNLSLADTITIWSDLGDMDTSRPFRNWSLIYNEYERVTGNKVEIVYVPFSDFVPKTLAAYAAGPEYVPDILGTDWLWYGSFLKYDLLEPFPSELKKKWDSVKHPFYGKLEIEGKDYGIPVAPQIYGLTYNKNMFREAGLDPNKPPEMWEEFRDYAKRLTKYDSEGNITRVGYAIRYIGYPFGVAQKMFWAFWSAGVNVIDPPYTDLRGGRAGINNEGGIKAIELYTKMLYEDRSTAFGFPDPRDSFMEGKAAMQVSGIHAITPRRMRESPDMDYGIAVPPRPKGGVKATMGQAHPLLCVTSVSDKKDAAFDFLEFLLRPGVDLYRALTFGIHPDGFFGGKPLLKSNWENYWFKENSFYKDFLEVWKVSRPSSPNVRTAEACAALGKYMVLAWERKISAEEAVQMAEEEMNEILQGE